jgi:hypothetical protein
LRAPGRTFWIALFAFVAAGCAAIWPANAQRTTFEWPATPASGTASAVERAPEGGKPGITEVQSVEVTAEVESIDYKTRMVKLRGPEGKTRTVKAGPSVKRLDEVKVGDTVVVRYTEALSVQVTAPTEAVPAKKK